jgi:ureidoacrylate peracid hydrolase
MRQAGGMVVWIKTEARPEICEEWQNFLELYQEKTRTRRFASLSPGGTGFDLWRELDVHSDDEIVIKTRYSAFIQGSSNIEEVLRARQIETVLVARTVTNICCDSTARDAMMRGFRTIMVSDANAAFNEQDHDFALNTFIRAFGDVHTTDDVVENLRSHQDLQRSVG